MDVRHEGDESVLITNLVVHHSIANTLDQTAKFIRVLDVVKKALHLRLLFHRLEFSESAFQFPNDPHASGLTLNPGRHELTIPVPSSLSLP
jgi:hypothetical protein